MAARCDAISTDGSPCVRHIDHLNRHYSRKEITRGPKSYWVALLILFIVESWTGLDRLYLGVKRWWIPLVVCVGTFVAAIATAKNDEPNFYLIIAFGIETLLFFVYDIYNLITWRDRANIRIAETKPKPPSSGQPRFVTTKGQ